MIINYFRWVRIRASSRMNGSESQNVVYKPSSLTLLVTSTVVNVVSGVGLPVESSLCFGSGLPVESDVKPRLSAGLLITSGVF